MEPHGSERSVGPRRRCVAWHQKRNVWLVPDVWHTRCSNDCDMWPDYASSACVCLASLAVHVCGSECTIAPLRLEVGEGFKCPLTSIVVQPSEHVATPMFDNLGRCVNHWSGKARIHRVPRKRRSMFRRVLKNDHCLRLMMQIMAGTVKSEVRKLQMVRAQKNVDRTLKASGVGRARTFLELQSIVVSFRRTICPAVRPRGFADTMKRVSDRVCDYMRRHPTCMGCSPDVATCTWLTILSTGLHSGATVAIERDDVVARHIPPPSMMALVPGIHCRSISVAVRKLKAYIFTRTGDVISSRMF
jgi:hypothetical protein